MKKPLKTFLLRSVVIIALAFVGTHDAFSQQQRNIVQLSGLVMNADSTESVFGVHIFDTRTGRGTISDFRGWFSHAFYAGDTIIFSSVRFKNRTFVVPKGEGEEVTVIVSLQEEVTQLSDVEVNPFPTEELFKEAILAMNLNEDQENVLNSFDPAIVQQLVRTMPIEGSADMNYRYLMNQQYNNLRYSSGPRSNPLLNPFAWASFINSLKKKKKN